MKPIRITKEIRGILWELVFRLKATRSSHENMRVFGHDPKIGTAMNELLEKIPIWDAQDEKVLQDIMEECSGKSDYNEKRGIANRAIAKQRKSKGG